MPFSTLSRQLAAATPDDVVQLVGNLLLLAPIGVYGPLLAPRLRAFGATLLVGLAASVAIELGQLGLSALYGFPIRIADVDDVMLNTAGVGIGYACWWTASRWRSTARAGG